jgi:hypothetical protein
LHEALCGLAFATAPGVSRRASAVPRRMCGEREIAHSLFGRGIAAMFAEALLPSPTDFVRLLVPLIAQVPEFAEFARSGILASLIGLIGTHPGNDELHHALGNAIAQILERTESPAVLEQFDVASEVVQSASVGLAAALEQWDRVARGRRRAVRGDARWDGGVPPRCDELPREARGAAGGRRRWMRFSLRLSRCALPMEEDGVWSVGHALLISALAVLQSVAARSLEVVADALVGRMQTLLCPAVLDCTVALLAEDYGYNLFQWNW